MTYYTTTTGDPREETKDQEIKRLKKELKIAERDQEYERCMEIYSRLTHLTSRKDDKS